MTKHSKKQTLSRASKERIAALPVRKQAYVAARLRGESKNKAALEAGYSKSVAKNASDVIETQDVTQALRSALRELIPIDLLDQRVREGLDAKAGRKANIDLRGRYVDRAAKLLGVKGMSVGAEAEEKPQVVIHLDY